MCLLYITELSFYICVIFDAYVFLIFCAKKPADIYLTVNLHWFFCSRLGFVPRLFSFFIILLRECLWEILEAIYKPSLKTSRTFLRSTANPYAGYLLWNALRPHKDGCSCRSCRQSPSHIQTRYHGRGYQYAGFRCH